MDYLRKNGIVISDKIGELNGLFITIDLSKYNFKEDEQIINCLLNFIDINSIIKGAYDLTPAEKVYKLFKTYHLYGLLKMMTPWRSYITDCKYVKLNEYLKIFKFIKNKIRYPVSYSNLYLLFQRLNYSCYLLRNCTIHLKKLCKILNIPKNLKYSFGNSFNNTKYYKIRKCITVKWGWRERFKSKSFNLNYIL